MAEKQQSDSGEVRDRTLSEKSWLKYLKMFDLHKKHMIDMTSQTDLHNIKLHSFTLYKSQQWLSFETRFALHRVLKY